MQMSHLIYQILQSDKNGPKNRLDGKLLYSRERASYNFVLFTFCTLYTNGVSGIRLNLKRKLRNRSKA